jgi:dimethylglycine dehydrogenase
MDLSAFAKLDVSGPDAAPFLDRLVANRVPRKLGGIVLTHVLNEAGTIEAEVTAARLAEDRFYLMFAAFSELRVRDWLIGHRRADEKVEIENLSEAFGCLVLSGPRSREVLRQLTQAPLDTESFRWLTAREIEVAGAPLRALRLSYVGELGWELHVPMEHMARVYDAVWDAGQAHGIENFGSYALNAMRLEKGFKGASELTNEVTLPEADVMRFVKLDKGDFVGREATVRSLEGARPWVCAYLAVEADDADCLGGESLWVDGRRVGAVSSGGYGHSVKKSLAFAYVEPDCAEPGRELEVMVLGERRPARVLGEAVYDPASEKPRM